MSPGQRAALLACALLIPLMAPTSASACELVLSEHRSEKELARLDLDPVAPSFQIAFTHSVLETPVEDDYRLKSTANGWRAHLVEERWVGEGYGLPINAGPDETLERDGDGWRLKLDRLVHPLIVRPLPAQHMRVVVAGREPLLLGTLSDNSIAFDAENCP